jgi:hypothetical protein
MKCLTKRASSRLRGLAGRRFKKRGRPELEMLS